MKTGTLALIALVRTLLRRRLVRFALVGGVGIPINVAFLWFFHSLLRVPLAPAWIFAFEPSALINFYATSASPTTSRPTCAAGIGRSAPSRRRQAPSRARW